MNISQHIVIEPKTLILAAYERRPVNIAGNYFLLISNSLTTKVQIAIGNGQLKEWRELYSFRCPNQGEFFDKIVFYNPTASSMTVEYIISNGIVQNESASLVGEVDVVDISDSIETPASFFAQDLDGWLIDNAAAVNVGGGVVGIPVTGQSFSTGDSITISGTTNYNNTYTVLASSSANQVNITATYNAETFDGVDDTITPVVKSIAANSDRKELIINNLDLSNTIWLGDANIDPANYRGIPVYAQSSFIITNTAQIYIAADSGVGVSGVRISYAELTRS